MTNLLALDKVAVIPVEMPTVLSADAASKVSLFKPNSCPSIHNKIQIPKTRMSR